MIEEVISKLIAPETLGDIALHTIGDGAFIEVSVEVDFDLAIEARDEVLAVITESVVIESINS